MAKIPHTHLIVELDVKMHNELKLLAVTEETSMASIIRHCIKTRIDKKKAKVVY